jgi:DNA-binding response OmpR family regulator
MVGLWHDAGSCVANSEREGAREPFVLDCGERKIEGIAMSPLLGGEFKLLKFLGTHSGKWHSCHVISVCVYGRDDLAAHQLVWKYVSTLRKKLAPALPDLIELCRRRGYRCRVPLSIREHVDIAAGCVAR